MNQPANHATSAPIVTFWGAARTVTGSMHLVEAAGRRILLDCGLFQGRRAEARRRNGAFPFRPAQVDAVILSHAHIDHCGIVHGDPDRAAAPAAALRDRGFSEVGIPEPGESVVI